ncbi:hypothetical protein MSAN_00575900 [Mycena sanguinolenta]|uniref:Uncharacterized protein n=1 Tax=Mycena sanguinolenta TaxID=230812 RepID=A0A8H6Z9W9_9AGAR|nr:hypothetical protein MSAN_00575900 [Mycena sanguinolenta]
MPVIKACIISGAPLKPEKKVFYKLSVSETEPDPKSATGSETIRKTKPATTLGAGEGVLELSSNESTLKLKKSVYVKDNNRVSWVIDVPKWTCGTSKKPWISFEHVHPQAGKFEVDVEGADVFVDGGAKLTVRVIYENLETRATEVLDQLETQRLTE